MFTSFFYLLRARGLKVSMNEWLSLLEGLRAGLHNSSLTGFYHLARALLVKSESDFDRFDQAFLEFFKNVPYSGELPEELLNWVNKPMEDLGRTMEELMDIGFPQEELDELLKRLEERIKEQTEEHNGGSYWVGTQGRSPFGNNGWHPNGIRIGGQSRNRTALSVAGERKYRDFRRDNTLDTRQFQMAFRTLRQLSYQSDTAERIFDVDGTIRATADNAGTLSVQYMPPRKNTVKLLLLMDSGGSMYHYASLCSMLFQAATECNHFKELHTYYFHNCPYESLYTDPRLTYASAVPTEWVLNNYDPEYRVLIVGDAEMNQGELWGRLYDWRARRYSEETGISYLTALKNHFPHLVWLNPEPKPETLNFWTETHLYLADFLPMFDLTVDGLETAMKRLMVSR